MAARLNSHSRTRRLALTQAWASVVARLGSMAATTIVVAARAVATTKASFIPLSCADAALVPSAIS